MPRPTDGAPAEALRRILGSYTEPASILPAPLPADLVALLDLLRERLFDPDLSVSALRRWCRLRDHNVSSRFRLFTGRTLKGYIEAQRLHAAKQLLQQTSLPIVDVAFAVGYRHVQTFYAAFARQVGCTPAQYRGDGLVREVGT